MLSVHHFESFGYLSVLLPFTVCSAEILGIVLQLLLILCWEWIS